MQRFGFFKQTQSLSAGLELTLEKDVSPLSSKRAACGVLLCVEESVINTNQTLADRDPRDQVSQIATISSLKVFKLDASSTTNNGGGKRRNLLASVSSQQSRLTRVSNGVKIDGRLEPGRATLRLELSKQDDCQAEFVCQTQGVDSNGRELIITSHILQQSENNQQKNHLTWTPRLGIEVSSSDQLLSAKLAVMGSAIGNLENEMRLLKDAAQHDSASLKTDLSTKTDRLEDKIQNLGKDLDTQTDRLEDKMESFEKGLSKRFTRLEDKVESLVTRLEDKIESLLNHRTVDKVGESTSCQNGISADIKRQINTEMMNLAANISNIRDNIAQVEKNLGKNVNASFLKINQTLGAYINNNHRLINNTPLATVAGEFDSLKSSMQEKFDKMSLYMNLSSLETRSMISAQLQGGNTSVGAELKSVLNDLMQPKNCYKGMNAAASFSSSPYTVIHPSQENSLGVPVLCDTFTSGGGWIVFQRRATGDVNFYRGWEEYKQGFGSLDGDFWLGNENIHAITSTGVFELRIDMMYNGNFAFAHYDSFSVGNEKSNYVLHVAHYDGTAGESLSGEHNGKPFSTHDRDNDNWGNNCAIEYVGAWWYDDCHHSNLNGQWGAGGNKGPRWSTLSGANAVSFSEMKVRRII